MAASSLPGVFHKRKLLPILEGQSLFLVHYPTLAWLKISFVPIFCDFFVHFFPNQFNLVILAIFSKFLSNVPLSGQKSHFFKDFVPFSSFDRLAGMHKRKLLSDVMGTKKPALIYPSFLPTSLLPRAWYVAQLLIEHHTGEVSVWVRSPLKS